MVLGVTYYLFSALFLTNPRGNSIYWSRAIVAFKLNVTIAWDQCVHSPMMVSALVSDKPETSKYELIQCDTKVKGRINSLL